MGDLDPSVICTVRPGSRQHILRGKFGALAVESVKGELAGRVGEELQFVIDAACHDGVQHLVELVSALRAGA